MLFDVCVSNRSRSNKSQLYWSERPENKLSGFSGQVLGSSRNSWAQELYLIKEVHELKSNMHILIHHTFVWKNSIMSPLWNTAQCMSLPESLLGGNTKHLWCLAKWKLELPWSLSLYCTELWDIYASLKSSCIMWYFPRNSMHFTFYWFHTTVLDGQLKCHTASIVYKILNCIHDLESCKK